MKLVYPCAAAILAILAGAVLFRPHVLKAGPGSPTPVSPAAVSAKNMHLAENFGKLPLSFEANQGQTDGRVKFLSRGRGYSLLLTGNEAVLSLHRAAGVATTEPRLELVGRPVSGRVAPIFRPPDSGEAHHRLFGAAATPDHLSLSMRGKEQENEVEKPRDRRAGPALPLSTSPLRGNGESSAVLRMRLVGANTSAAVTGAEELPGKSNYFIGNDPKKWRTNVPNYAKVKYQNVYPGVDLVYYGNQGGQLEYDFVVAPGADPSVIALDVAAGSSRRQSAENGDVKPPLLITSDGDLVIEADGGEVRFHKPVGYQIADRHRTAVDGEFHLRTDGTVGFVLGSYDRGKALLIDPALVYSTYLGGNSLDVADAIVVDAAGNAYVSGSTSSTDFPVTNGAFQTTNYTVNGFGVDSFIAKLNPTGSALVYSTFLGGSDCCTYAIALAVDGSGNAYVTGPTNSTTFPVTQGAFQTTKAENQQVGFVTKLNPTGSGLDYSTYLGGSGGDGATGLALDGSSNAYITGTTGSTDFPVTQGAYQTTNKAAANDTTNAFITKLNPAGSALVYSTFLGGSGIFTATYEGYGDYASGLAVDGSGNAYITGQTYSTDFPVTVGAFQTTNHAAVNSGDNAFVTKLNPTGSALIYSTYLGGSGVFYKGGDGGSALAVDGSGNAYVTGGTESTDFPSTPGAFQTTNYGGAGLFVSKLNSTGSALVYSTFLNGSDGNDSSAYGVAVDGSGNAYITGGTHSSDFPVTQGAFQTTNAAAAAYGANAFFTRLNPTGTALDYSTYLGGSGGDEANGLALDDSGNAYITGATYSTNFPVTAGAYQTTNLAAASGGSNVFVTKISTAITGPFASLSSLNLTFGSQNLGATSAPQTETVTNAGTTDLDISTVTIGGANANDFAKSSDTCTGATVTPNGTCTINVTFTPTTTVAESGSITITDNAPNSPQAVSLTGTGTAATPVAGVSPSSLTFSDQNVGTTSASQSVTLNNTGTASLTITSIATSSNFSQTNTCGGSVAASGSCTISVTFTPTATGSLTGALTITDNSNGVTGSKQSVTLSGTGQDFTLTATTTSDTVAPGSSASFTLNLTGEAGFNQSMSLACTGAPSEATCTVSPTPVTAGSTATSVTVTVSTTAPSVSAPRSRPLPPAAPLSPAPRGLLMLALVFAVVAWAIRRQNQLGATCWQSTMVPLAGGLLLSLALAGCGGGGSIGSTTTPSNPGTPAGTYPLTVTGTAGSGSSAVSHSVTLTLTVS